ncbi:GNAT family N-acetyltransferase [Streptomyces afghaniensis]|uniref:GNAT family N-acetyltransferase n=1 Tax=Streptomyces afghaniensis TaxID=66865 RepID=UPI00278617C3|nr:GNAT family N-acetyltransferase [Streptomyces afghaniensis]MDQ1020582.1 ribosomal protein S18 acetylase RimI-like enzyme [Streptomyces afghaniensis]
MIRTVLPAEVADVVALHGRARATYYPDGLPQDGTDWHAAWRRALARPDGRVLCAVEEGRMVGLASFRTPEGAPTDTVKLLQFHVDPGHWRRGVGSALHTACAEAWTSDGTRTAVLEVHVDNRRAQRFYRRHGWMPEPAEPGDHHLTMRLRLPAE